ncbi:S-layer homology domain-containing protein [Paenibacillus sp. 2KB_22]|uniref:S-layer homology domain-containing protein n=1 Tax=Paenibacillus sp. 2KB_22 TaxID=3232978 RepID=UPI003F94EA75
MRKLFGKKMALLVVATLLTNTLFSSIADANDNKAIKRITANTYIGDLGTMVDSFDIVVDDIDKFKEVQSTDFDVTGNYDGYSINEKEETVQSNYENDGIELHTSGQTLHLKVKAFRYPGGPKSDFVIYNSKYSELSFTKEDVSQIKTRTVDDFKAGTFTGSNGHTLSYQLKQSESNEARPLVVWLHGGGEVGNDNLKQLTENRGATVWTESGKDTSVLAVQYPKNYGWAIYNNPEQLKLMQDYFLVQYELILDLIKEDKVDANRIYLVGASSGGGGAFRFMMQYPDLFAGSLVIAAKDAIADYKGSVDVFKEELKDLVKTPIWIIHAENDPITDSRTSTLAFKALSELGSSVVKETIYDDAFMNKHRLFGDLKHLSWVPTFNDSTLVNWLFNQRKSDLSEILSETKEVTRAQLANALVHALHLPTVTDTKIYSDINSSKEKQQILQVTHSGLMNGVANSIFSPEGKVTRAQLATVATNWIGNSDYTDSTFTLSDIPVDHWAYSSIIRVIDLNLMNMNDRKQFEPNKPVSGEEVQDLLLKLATYNINNN